MAMELTVYLLNGLLLCCLRSKYEPEIFYETKVTGLQRPLYENRSLRTNLPIFEHGS